jgi:hypothetical protein
MSNKTNFKPKLIGKDKANRFKLIKGALHQEEITIINISTLNIDAPNFIKHCWTFLYINNEQDETEIRKIIAFINNIKNI